MAECKAEYGDAQGRRAKAAGVWKARLARRATRTGACLGSSVGAYIDGLGGKAQLRRSWLANVSARAARAVKSGTHGKGWMATSV